MSNENFDFRTSWNLCFPPLEPKISALFWLDTSVDIAFTCQLYDVNSTGLFLTKNFVWRFLIFAYRVHLQVLKVRDLKLLCLNQLYGLKDRKIKVGFKMKSTIGDGMKMFRKYQLAVWRSIQNFYSHFTKVTRKCECFSHIVEPWLYGSLIYKYLCNQCLSPLMLRVQIQVMVRYTTSLFSDFRQVSCFLRAQGFLHQ